MTGTLGLSGTRLRRESRGAIPVGLGLSTELFSLFAVTPEFVLNGVVVGTISIGPGDGIVVELMAGLEWRRPRNVQVGTYFHSWVRGN